MKKETIKFETTKRIRKKSEDSKIYNRIAKELILLRRYRKAAQVMRKAFRADMDMWDTVHAMYPEYEKKNMQIICAYSKQAVLIILSDEPSPDELVEGDDD